MDVPIAFFVTERAHGTPDSLHHRLGSKGVRNGRWENGDNAIDGERLKV